MRRKTLHTAKLVVTVESDRESGRIFTESVFDNRTECFWTADEILERGIVEFMNVANMKETLNWNLNGDEKNMPLRGSSLARQDQQGLHLYMTKNGVL